MKPLQVTQREYRTLNGIGGWLILLAIRVVSGPVIGTLLIVLCLAGLTARSLDGFSALFAPGNWLLLLILSALLVYEILCAVFFFLKHRKFVLLYVILAVFNAVMLTVTGILNPYEISSFTLASFAWDIIFVMYLFRSRRAAITFKTRKLEIVGQDWVDLDENKNIFGTTRPIGIILVIGLVVGGFIFSNFAQRNARNSAIAFHTVSPEQIENSIFSSRPDTITPDPSASSRPTDSPIPTVNPKYDVLRAGAIPPSGGETFDPLQLLNEPSILGDTIENVTRNLKPEEYDTVGFYKFEPQFDYLGLGWTTNQVTLGLKEEKVTMLTYITESYETKKQAGFLSAVQDKYNALRAKYGDPATGSESFDDKMAELKFGGLGKGSAMWLVPGMKIKLDFTNYWQGKNGHLEISFELN